MWKLGLRPRNSQKGMHKWNFPCSADLSLEINNVDSHISFDKNRFVRIKSEINEFGLGTGLEMQRNCAMCLYSNNAFQNLTIPTHLGGRHQKVGRR
jgi:hypothetical protein